MLSRDEQRVVRRIGGWKIAHLLGAPDHWSTDYFGSSRFDALGDERHWLNCTATVIDVAIRDGGSVLTLKWSKVKAYAKTLPVGLTERIAANNRAIQKNMAACPRFAASGPACGHGRPLHWRGIEGPLTAGQALYVDEHDAWVASGVMNRWRAERDLLESEREHLLDEAFPLAVDQEPADLLELLGAIS